MVKIKRKVKMTLPELIEWGLENGIKSRRFTSNRLNSKYVGFDSLGGVCFNGLYSYLLEDTFTVEVKEEITDDTVLHVALELYYNTYSGEVCSTIHRSKSIKNIVKSSQDEFITKCLYLINEDMSMTMIYNIYK